MSLLSMMGAGDIDGDYSIILIAIIVAHILAIFFNYSTWQERILRVGDDDKDLLHA